MAESVPRHLHVAQTLQVVLAQWRWTRVSLSTDLLSHDCLRLDQ